MPANHGNLAFMVGVLCVNIRLSRWTESLFRHVVSPWTVVGTSRLWQALLMRALSATGSFFHGGARRDATVLGTLGVLRCGYAIRSRAVGSLSAHRPSANIHAAPWSTSTAANTLPPRAPFLPIPHMLASRLSATLAA